MTSRPRISAVMPLFDKAKTVGRAVDSVLAQTMDRFELIVVDDGSTDAGPRIVRSVGDRRIRVLHQPNAGVSAARNAGIRAAQADTVAFLDADDEWHPGYLAEILDLKEGFPDCAVYATSYEIRVGETVRQATVRGLPKGFCKGVLQDYFLVASRSDPPLWSSAVAVKRDVIVEIGGFPVGIRSGEDLLTWAKLATRHKVAYSTEPLAMFWAPENAYDRPGRVPAIPDQVGQELARLMLEHAPEGLREYLAMWHRMRGATFLQLANGPEARKELAKALELGPSSPSLLALYVISHLRGPLARGAYLALRRAWVRRPRT